MIIYHLLAGFFFSDCVILVYEYFRKLIISDIELQKKNNGSQLSVPLDSIYTFWWLKTAAVSEFFLSDLGFHGRQGSFLKLIRNHLDWWNCRSSWSPGWYNKVYFTLKILHAGTWMISEVGSNHRSSKQGNQLSLQPSSPGLKQKNSCNDQRSIQWQHNPAAWHSS